MKYLKAVLNVVLIISVIFLLMYCSEGGEDLPVCINCDDYIEEGVKVAKTRDGTVCAECALRNEYIRCRQCDLYYCIDWTENCYSDNSKANLLYCEKCAEEKVKDCYFCDGAYLEEELAEFTYNNETYYMCIRHCEGYFDRQSFEICPEDERICGECVW